MGGSADALHDEIMQAHERGHTDRLAILYLKAGDMHETAGDIDAACFVLTIAYVFALECGDHATAQSAHTRLAAHGREG